MKFHVAEASPAEIAASWLIVGCFEGESLSPELMELDELLGGQLSRLSTRDGWPSKRGESLTLHDVPSIKADRLLIVNYGDESSPDLSKTYEILSGVLRKVASKEKQSAALTIPACLIEKFGETVLLERFAECATTACASQAIYRKERDRFELTEVNILGLPESPSNEEAIQRGRILGESINLTRELVNRHPNDIYPETFAARAVDAVVSHGVTGKILDEHLIENEKMGALMAVARGSARPPRVVVLEYRGAGEDSPTIGLVGKGVTFDSGGLSLKPSASMISMKADMAGAATVLGIVHACAKLELPVNILAVIGLVENMTGPSAYKLGEVLTARNGTTIEVHNTDAEGRLVLADALSYAVDHKADRLIDFATLTGACVVALGEELTGAFTNQQEWCDQVIQATRDSDELIWQLPMYDFYADQLKSDFADCKNIGTRWGGAITAAKFLEKFVDDVPWVHLDIAGAAYSEKECASRDAGGTGAMVRSIVGLLSSLNEESSK
ncbi:Cytosol aminopeptidase [Thalassoglobus neptunius]|uniref:Probable cytosol aminopeptidase n=1 Tax=Thalassoglobus neptunius TaxID=1938619 RepID=A0A5C5WMM2_9PLAN|nr:leucyl aminopeptidase [Thalassoglobus neptunius]TWT52076.1 Cytosol aminopeptidase [Thalassoglobus neptunius]